VIRGHYLSLAFLMTLVKSSLTQPRMALLVLLRLQVKQSTSPFATTHPVLVQQLTVKLVTERERLGHVSAISVQAMSN
jgi:hypothetical protein